VLVVGPPASAAPGWNNDASDAGGLACGAVGTLEVEDDSAATSANCVVVSWSMGAGCAPPNWTGPTVGLVAQVGHGPVD
jgi:hypothetical protein